MKMKTIKHSPPVVDPNVVVAPLVLGALAVPVVVEADMDLVDRVEDVGWGDTMTVCALPCHHRRHPLVRSQRVCSGLYTPLNTYAYHLRLTPLLTSLSTPTTTTLLSTFPGNLVNGSVGGGWMGGGGGLDALTNGYFSYGEGM